MMQPAGAALVGSSRDRAGEHRHPALGEAVRITHCCVDDETADTHRLARMPIRSSMECSGPISEPVDDNDVAGCARSRGSNPGPRSGVERRSRIHLPWRLCHFQLLVVGGGSALRALRR